MIILFKRKDQLNNYVPFFKMKSSQLKENKRESERLHVSQMDFWHQNCLISIIHLYNIYTSDTCREIACIEHPIMVKTRRKSRELIIKQTHQSLDLHRLARETNRINIVSFTGIESSSVTPLKKRYVIIKQFRLQVRMAVSCVPLISGLT